MRATEATERARVVAEYEAKLGALRAVPQVNAEYRDPHIVFRDYYDIGIAVGGGMPCSGHARDSLCGNQLFPTA